MCPPSEGRFNYSMHLLIQQLLTDDLLLCIQDCAKCYGDYKEGYDVALLFVL